LEKMAEDRRDRREVRRIMATKSRQDHEILKCQSPSDHEILPVTDLPPPICRGRMQDHTFTLIVSAVESRLPGAEDKPDP
jgi:hypothetical protein